VSKRGRHLFALLLYSVGDMEEFEQLLTAHLIRTPHEVAVEFSTPIWRVKGGMTRLAWPMGSGWILDSDLAGQRRYDTPGM